MKEFENMENLKEDLFETLADMFNPMKREDEARELQELEQEAIHLEFKMKTAQYMDLLMARQDYEWELADKQEQIKKLKDAR